MAAKPKPQPKAKSVRRPFVATDEERALVAMAKACGSPHWLIAEELGFSTDTLERHFRNELDYGLAKANVRAAKALYNLAIAGDRILLMFWLKTQAGWRETNRTEHTGPDGQPLHPPVDLTTLPDEALAALRVVAEHIEAAQPKRVADRK